MDRGAWQATVHHVAMSRTRRNDLALNARVNEILLSGYFREGLEQRVWARVSSRKAPQGAAQSSTSLGKEESGLEVLRAEYVGRACLRTRPAKLQG